MGDEETPPGGIPRAEGVNPPRGANSPPLRNLTVPKNTGPATPFHTRGELNRLVDVVLLNVNQGGPQGGRGKGGGQGGNGGQGIRT